MDIFREESYSPPRHLMVKTKVIFLGLKILSVYGSHPYATSDLISELSVLLTRSGLIFVRTLST